MTWAAWRLQRTETLIAAAMLALLAVAILPSGLHMLSVYHDQGVAKCLGPNTSWSCDEALHAFTSQFDSTNSLLAWTTLVPGMFGVLLAAPFVLELENGTYRLAWTQSVTRGRWVVGKLGFAVVSALCAGALFTAAMTWWHAPLVRAEGRMNNSIYDAVGIVPLGYTLFALALTIVIGVLWRRAVPALVVGFGAYFAVRLFVDLQLRTHFAPTHLAKWGFQAQPPASTFHAWMVHQYVSDIGPGSVCGPQLGPSKAAAAQCLAQHGATFRAVFHPASQFWALQGVETALFAGVAVVLLAFSAWWTNSRLA